MSIDCVTKISLSNMYGKFGKVNNKMRIITRIVALECFNCECIVDDVELNNELNIIKN